MEKVKCEIWLEYKKMHPLLFLHGMGKRVIFRGWQMLQFLGPEFIPDHKKCLSGKDGIFGSLVGGWSGILLVCGWFGWFLGGFEFYS